MAESEKDTDELREGLERIEDLKKKHLDDEQTDGDGSSEGKGEEPRSRD